MVQVRQTRHHIPTDHNHNTVMSPVCHTNLENNYLAHFFFSVVIIRAAGLLCPGEHFIRLRYETCYVSSRYPATSIVSRCLYSQYSLPGLTVMPGVQIGCWAISVPWQWRQCLALKCWHNRTSWCNHRPKKILLEFLCVYVYVYTHTHTQKKKYIYTCCPRKNVPDFGRVFLMLKYTDITQNTYIQSWTVMEIMAREKCGLLAVPRTAPVQLTHYVYTKMRSRQS